MSGFIIARHAGGNDVPAMYRIYNTNLDDYFPPEAIEYFMLQWPRGQFVAQAITGEVVGAMSSFMPDPSTASITLLAIDQRYRGIGAGSSLLNAFLPICIGSGITKVQLEARVTNLSAIEFYKKKGFVPSHILPHLYNDGGDGLRMVLDLNRASTDNTRPSMRL